MDSASPDLYVAGIRRILGFERTCAPRLSGAAIGSTVR